METITNLIKDTPIPKMVKVRQNFDKTCIPESDIPGIITRELDRPEIGGKIQPGQKIAITCGSRGINHNAVMARAIVDFVKSKGAEPYIVAAMGSHGGATAEGQLQILKDYGITEEAMGCPVKSSMETVQIGISGVRHQPVYVDKNASEADGIILYNRIKPHTSFRGPYESGLMKMMAIGLGKMFGFHFLENFNYPYISRSITEFWRRWHISLSTWFRDYVYFPLGGSRVNSKAKHIRNLFVVWLLTGVWHGANWTFLAWGLFYFVLLVLEKYGGLGRGWPVWAKWLFTFLMVNFAWVLFRADSLAAAGQYLQAMFGLGAGGWDDLTALYLRENWTVLAASVLFAGPLAPRLRDWAAKKDSPLLDAGYAVLAAAVFLVSAAFLIKGTYNPFIYFNF